MFVLTAFTLTALDYRSTGDSSAFDAVRRGSDTVFGPAQRALGGVTHSVGSFFGGLSHVGRERDENAKLRDDNDRLRAQLRETDSLRRQVSEWNALLGLKDAGGFTLQAAHVISLGSSPGFEGAPPIHARRRRRGR